MRNVVTVVIAIVLLTLVGGAVLAQSGNDLFQQALVKERTEGNLAEAIKLYQTIVQKYGSDRKLAAKALFQIGQAYEKLGNAEARKAYERIARDFADQKDVAADAGRRLAVLAAPQVSDKPSVRTVLTDNIVGSGSISRDGRWMAMTDWSTADGDLVVREMATNQIRRLQVGGCGKGSKNCTFADSRVFSPDARQVAYAWYDETEINGGAQLRVIANEVGAKPRVLVRNPEYEVWPRGWSADGKSILVVMERPDRTWQLGWVSVADGSIKTITSLGWRIQQALSYSVSPSPDGRYIAYSALPTNPSKAPPPANAAKPTETHIYILSADGHGETELVKTAGINESPVWTPDSAHVLFVSGLSGKSDLWSAAVRDGKAEGSPFVVRRDVGGITPIGMTRSGSYYYIQSLAGIEQVSIAELVPEGGNRILESFVGINPAWSPDGKSVAFSRHNARGNSNDQVVRSVETGDERVYIHDGLLSAKPRWFHDGKGFLQNVVLSGRPLESNFIDIRSGELKQVFAADNYVTVVTALSPDDRTLYFLYRDPKSDPPTARILAVDLSTRQQRHVFTLPRNIACGFALSPDGRTLAITTLDNGEGRLGLLSIDGSDYHEIYGPFRAANVIDKLAWTKDGRAILFATSESNANDNWQIMRIGIEGGKPQFTGLSVRALNSFDLSPDSSRIAYSTTAAATSTSELLAIDNLPALLKDSK